MAAMPRAGFMLLAIVLLTAPLLLTGCVRRTITITSEPSGALVWLNGREIGRTPVTVDFLHYGVYDVQLEAEGMEPLLTKGHASPPWWDNIPLDLAVELIPAQSHAQFEWHYVMQPRDDDPNALVERARQLRSQLHADAASSAAAAAAASPSSASAVESASLPAKSD